MKQHRITLSSGSYDIFIEANILNRVAEFIPQVYTHKKIFILTDENVAPLHLNNLIQSLQNYEVQSVVIPAGEDAKSLPMFAHVCEELLKKEIRRNNLLIGLGGGVIGDLAGFVAATLFRGLPFINIPTTLLSQMDSSIGGKTGIDFYQRKNILGSFYQPKMVLIDPLVLNTLPQREFNNGMGELIKHALIGNSQLFYKLKTNPKIDEDIIYESLSVKKRVVELDEFDQGERMSLNFGHTFGHAIELKSEFKHGECVSLGMVMALKLGMDLGITPSAILSEVTQVLKTYNLPCDDLDYHSLLKDIIYDKKNLAGVINFIFLDAIGSYVIVPIDEEKIKSL